MKTKTKLTNRILSLVLTFVMVLGMLPMSSITASAASASAPTVRDNSIYANGTPLYIVAGTTSGTAVYYLNGSQNKVYVNSRGAAGDDLSSTIIWGGYYEAALDGDVNITMTGGQVNRINGTGYHYNDSSSGCVNNVNITISGGSVSDSINAGWMNTVKGNVNITVTGGSVGTIRGCCYSSQSSVAATVKGNVNITITGGSVSQVHGGDGSHTVSGTVSGLITYPVSFLNNTAFGDMTYRFNNLLYINGENSICRGNVTVPAGVAVTVAVGEKLTIPANATLINNGTLVNNGTITVNGTLNSNGTLNNNGTITVNGTLNNNDTLGNSGTITANGTLNNHGTLTNNSTIYLNAPMGDGEDKITGNEVIRNALCIETTASGTPVVYVNGSKITDFTTECSGGKLYIYPKYTGNVKVTLNGKDYYGIIESETGSSELSSTDTPVTDIIFSLTEMSFGQVVDLADHVSTNAIYEPTFTYEVLNNTTAQYSLSGSKLTARSAGTIALKITAQDPFSRCEETFTITIAATDVIDVEAGSVTVSKSATNGKLTVTWGGFDGGSKEYDETDSIVITSGSGTNQGTIIVQDGVTANIVLNGVDITTSYTSPFHIQGTAKVNLTLLGDNVLDGSSAEYSSPHKAAGIRVESGASLTIDGTGTLTARGGESAAGIGGGYQGSSGTVTISGGTVTAEGGTDGAGIGGGSQAAGGTITISGGTVTATGGNEAAGIGGGRKGAGGTITISGGMVTATGRTYGAGIGGGRYSSGGDITISGGTVTANGGNDGAGIGGGGNDGYGGNITVNGGSITINGGTVTAGGGRRAAGIGGGYSGAGGTVVITGGTVRANAGDGASAIGAGYNGSDAGTLTNGTDPVSLVTVTLNGAADDTAVSAVTGMTYGVNGVKTMDTDKLYFYLTSGTEATAITAGGVEYGCNRNLTYYTEHEFICKAAKNCSLCDYIGGEHNFVDGECAICGVSDAGVYYISTPKQLMDFAARVNGGAKNVNAILTDDIDLAGYEWTTICETVLYYNAYGTDYGYSGIFDGNGHIIKNITVKSSETMDASCGLFGTVSGTIKNLGIEGFTFVDGGKDIRAGAIVGQLITANGKVSNCYVKGATITPGEHVTGGIAGCVYEGTIENCYVVESTITGSSGRFGHIVGDSRGDGGDSDRSGKVTNCYSDNAPIRSNNAGKIENCETKSKEAFASGEVTYLLNGSKSDGNLLWYQTIGTDSLPKFAGGTVYKIFCVDAECYSNENKNYETHNFEGLICTRCGSLDFTADENGINQIYTAEDLMLFAKFVNNGNTTANAKLMADIDLSEHGNVMIGTSSAKYSGKFDGNGKKLTINFNTTEEYTAPFRYISGATIHDLTVDGTISTRKKFAAGLVAYSEGASKIERCMVGITIHTAASGDLTHGGLVANVSSGSMTIDNCGFIGSFTGDQVRSCGGFVGWAAGKATINNSYICGTFTTKTNDCYTFGRNPDNITIFNCYYERTYGTDNEGATQKSAEQFASGEVTYLLNGSKSDGELVWYQTIRTDSIPKFAGGTVYKGSCVGKECYSNENGHFDTHNFVDGICSHCGELTPAEQNSDGYYEIGNKGQLYWFAQQVNIERDTDADAILTADIDLAGYQWTTICETGLYYNAYGTDLGYCGTFDGNGHIIKNIIVKSSTTMDASCGLFGTVSGTIKNLGIEGFTFVDGGKDVRAGAIVGQLITANGKMSNCYVKGATVDTKEHASGGIAGCVYEGTIENCYIVESTVTGDSGRYGHIVGDSRGDGGASDRPGTVTNCYSDNARRYSNNMGNVTKCATKSEEAFASGEVTYLLNGSKSDGELVWYQTIRTDSIPKFAGGTVYKVSCKDVEYYSNENKNYDTHNFVEGICSHCGEPMPAVENNGIYEISNAGQYIWFAKFVNASNPAANAKLMADIDLAGYKWTTICETGLYYNAYGTNLGYSGIFDGNGHIIKNITVKSSTTKDASCGLFGTVSGTIKNLGVENFTFVDGGKDIRAGAIVGQLITANGKVSNCYVKGATITPGEHVTGGIAGCVYDGTIENCYVVESTITGSSGRFGYIVGDSRGDKNESDRPGTVTNCYSDNATLRSDRIGNVENCGTKSKEAFASGEVTYLLNGSTSEGDLVWYQTISTDTYPQFTGSVVHYDSEKGYYSHIHNWTYTKDGNKITATCKNSDGGCSDTNGGYVTIAVPSDLTYTGNKIEADVDDKLTTGAAVEVTYTGKTTGGYPVNAGDYTASITLDGKTISAEYTIDKATPTADDFVFTAPTDLTYDGTDKEATVTVKDGIIGMGEIQVMYFRYSSGMWIDNQRAPHYPGKYKVGIWLTEGDNYNAVYSNDVIWLGDEFEITYLITDATADISGTPGSNGWYTSAVTLNAPNGYTISDSIYETYGESITFDSEQNKTVTYYLKNNESGKVAEKTVELKIDLNDPTARYSIKGNGWREFVNFISFGIFCKDNADLSITASDTMDDSVTVQYVVSTEKLTASEITNWNDYSNKVALNPKAKNYIYIKVTDDAGRTVVYESGVVVFADSTASAEIDYTKHSTEDVTAQIALNGNTVKEVKCGSTVLTADHYTVTDSGIQFKADYLNTFAAGNYSFVVTYNPVGESWAESADGIANDAIGTTTIALTVKKATLTITGATLADKTYDGATSGTVSGVTFKETDKLVLGTDYTATVVYDSENAGSRTATVTVTLLNTDKANAYALESTTYTMGATISKANAPALTDVKADYKFTITGFEADIANVGMPAAAGTITYTKGNAFVNGNATVTAWSVDESGKVTATISGGAKLDVITLPVTVSSDNYEDAVVNVVVTLGNRPAQSALTVKADSSVIYGNKLTLSTEGGSGTGDVTYSIVSGSENATIEGNVLTATKVGTVVITATKAGDNDYEPVTSAQFTIEVAQRELVITGATATDRDYNGTADVTITNITLDNIHSNDDVSVTFNTTGVISSANKGKYNEVTVSGLLLDGADAANYKLPESADGKYTVSTEVEISALDISGAEITLGDALTYNGSEQTQTVTGVTKNGLTVTYTVSDNKNTNYGSYELTITGTDNFTGTQTKAWSIAKRKITVTATAQTITYGKDITADAFTSTNMVDGHELDVTLTPSTADVTVSGTITVTVNDITADGTSVIGNYDVSVSSGKLTIQPDLSAISDLTTENVTSADKADIEAVKDMMSKADYANADEGTKAAWDAIVADCDTLLDKIKAVADEIDRVTDKTGSYNASTVNSDDAADLNKLAADIKALTDSKNLTNEERTELTALAETVAALQKVVTDTTAENKRIAEELAKFDKDTVNSDSSDALAQLLTDIEKQLDSTNLTEVEKKALEDAKTKAEDLLNTIEDAAEATTSENTEKVKDVTTENVTPEDKTDLENAKADLEKALEDNGGNYTEDEKKAIEDEIKRIEDALEVIGNVEAVEELIDKLPDTIKKDDEAAIKALDDAYNALTDYEKSLVDKDAKKALDDAKAALAELNKPADPNSTTTGDNSKIFLWIALLFIIGGAIITLIVIDRKRKSAAKK